MKRILPIIVALLIAKPSFSQNKSNSWIDFSGNQPYSDQQYYKVKIVNEGLYRIPVSALIAAGIPLKTTLAPGNAIDARSLQIFNNGQEQYIRLFGESSGIIDANQGYVEFYGKGNDGWLDKKMYVDTTGIIDSSAQVNPYFSLINDTAVYFITANSSINNKRMLPETDVAFGGYNPAVYFLSESLQNYSDIYSEGKHDAVDSTDPEYTFGECFAGPDFSFFEYGDFMAHKKPNALPQLYTPNVALNSNVGATLQSAVIGLSDDGATNPDHHFTVSVNSSGTLYEKYFDGYMAKPFSVDFSLTSLSSPTSTVHITSTFSGTPPLADRNTVPFIKLTYPHSFDFSGETLSSYRMNIPEDPSQVKTYINLSNFADGGLVPILYDLTNHKIIDMVKVSNQLNALLPNVTGNKICFISAESAITTINATDIKPISTDNTHYAKFINYEIKNPDADFIIITNSQLIAGANRYASYRTSKGSKVLVADVEDLYNQFAYGIDRHPLSIRNFADYFLTKFPNTNKDKFVFLIGKSIQINESRNGALSSLNLVPTIGNPPGDNMLVTRIQGSQLEPAMAIGRISARVTSDVDDYLNKVSTYESNAPDEWMKEGLHLGGGENKIQQDQFESYLDGYKYSFQDSLFGGHIATFLKSDVNPQINPSDSIRKIVEKGVSIITFFGHSSPTIFDYSINEPSNYNITSGHYSLFIANGCFAGATHQNQKSSSEQYVLIANKGSIGFIGSSGLSIADALNAYTSVLYRNFSKDTYGKSIGRAIQLAVQDVMNFNKLGLKEVCLQIGLEGDPSIVINAHPKPDYKITPSDLSFFPQDVTTEIDSFNVNLLITNIGRVDKDTFYVDLKRHFPNNTDTTYRKVVTPVFYKRTITYRLPVDLVKGPGINSFDVTVDVGNRVDEISTENPLGETNNQILSSQLIIRSDDVRQIFPIKYAIIDKPLVTFKALTGNIYAKSSDYIFELDTTDLFNSTVKLNTTITQTGGVISWTPSGFVPKDSTVYYWRTSLKGSNRWSESSFTYIPNKTGWSQAHIYQFKKDNFEYTKYNEPARRIDFVKGAEFIRAKSFTRTGQIDNGFPDNEYAFYVNLVSYRNGVCKYNSIIAEVFDPKTGAAWQSHSINPPGAGQYNNSHCSSDNYFYGFDFQTDYTAGQEIFRHFLDTIPAGYYLLLYSVRDPHIKDFDSNLKQALRNFGCTKTDTISHGQAYIMFGKKGGTTAHEVVSSLTNQVILLDDSIPLNLADGKISTERIGPAQKWKTMLWRSHSLEVNSSDVISTKIIGVNNSGVESVLKTDIPKDSSAVDLSFINADNYPYLRLEASVKDTVLRTPPQLDKWQVLYTGVPEGSLNPSKYFTFYKDTVEEGDVIKFGTTFENISDLNMDSLLVRSFVYDKNRVKHILYDKKRKPLLAAGNVNHNDSINTTISFDTRGFDGNNSIWLELNPDNNQKEQYHFNNLTAIPFYVKKDRSNPLLDVTFDGVHILNGDIVSAKPEILIRMNDDNKYLAINDTSMFKLWLLPPGQTSLDNNQLFFRNAFVNGNTLRFSPATLPGNNSAEVQYKPLLVADGVYTLIVEGVDASKNASGKIKYRLNFEVVTKSSITEVMNYPNPFSTSTKFVFTLTGSEIPVDFKIQIMTVTSKIIREITINELGPIHIGRNITEYAWDGKDEFGDQLANGLYLYRVVSSLKGNAIEKRETGADKYFVKGYGKMYLLR